MLYFMLVCLYFTTNHALAAVSKFGVSEQRMQNTYYNQNLEATLNSIDEKLRQLEVTYSTQCSPATNIKIEYYGRKIDKIEQTLSRFETIMKMELEKVSENISSKNFKDDISKDRTLRKMDAVYERLTHRLGNIETQLDVGDIKLQNTREMILTKLEKMEESLTIRDSDMEAEIADAVAAIDDLKSACIGMEEIIINTTKDAIKVSSKSNEKMTKKQYMQTASTLEKLNQNISTGFEAIQRTAQLLLNTTNNNLYSMEIIRDELAESTNEYTNKITNMYTDLWEKNENIELTVYNMAKIGNLTRSEQQNGLRALMVQIGRTSGKSNTGNNSSHEYQKLAEISEKIDSNFENVMLAQNLFLESCHRVQMDEAQIESQISIVLNTLIDTFENKTTVQPKDIKNLEHLIRVHDSNVRRSIHDVTNTILAVSQQAIEANSKIENYMMSETFQLDALHLLIHDFIDTNNISVNINSIIEALKVITNHLDKVDYENMSERITNQITNTFEMLFKNANYIAFQQIAEYLKNIYHILNSIDSKINKSYLDYFFNKYNVDVVAHRFGQKLNQYIQHVDGTNLTRFESVPTKAPPQNSEVPKLLLEIFGVKPGTKDHNNFSTDPYEDYPYHFGQTEDNFGKQEIPNTSTSTSNLCDIDPNFPDIDIRYGNFPNNNCTKISNTTPEIITDHFNDSQNTIDNDYKTTPTPVTQLINCSEIYDIDVQYNIESEDFLNCSKMKLLNTTNNTDTNNNDAKNNNETNLPDYTNQIDVRSYNDNETLDAVTKNTTDTVTINANVFADTKDHTNLQSTTEDYNQHIRGNEDYDTVTTDADNILSSEGTFNLMTSTLLTTSMKEATTTTYEVDALQNITIFNVESNIVQNGTGTIQTESSTINVETTTNNIGNETQLNDN